MGERMGRGAEGGLHHFIKIGKMAPTRRAARLGNIAAVAAYEAGKFGSPVHNRLQHGQAGLNLL